MLAKSFVLALMLAVPGALLAQTAPGTSVPIVPEKYYRYFTRTHVL